MIFLEIIVYLVLYSSQDDSSLQMQSDKHWYLQLSDVLPPQHALLYCSQLSQLHSGIYLFLLESINIAQPFCDPLRFPILFIIFTIGIDTVFLLITGFPISNTISPVWDVNTAFGNPSFVFVNIESKSFTYFYIDSKKANLASL